MNLYRNTVPFGILNNDAFHPMIIDGISYKSVTDYVYVNLFTQSVSRHEMGAIPDSEKFNKSFKLRALEDEHLYSQSIKDGTKERLLQNKPLLSKLQSLKGYQLQVNIQDKLLKQSLEEVFNLLIDNESIFISEKYGSISAERINNVVNGVIKSLNKNIKDEPFLILEEKYSIPESPSTHIKITDLDKIVSTIKNLYLDRDYARQYREFQDQLLNEALNNVLKIEYPHISRNDYTTAKKQQKDKERNLQFFIDELTSLYDKGLLNFIPTVKPPPTPTEPLSKLESQFSGLSLDKGSVRSIGTGIASDIVGSLVPNSISNIFPATSSTIANQLGSKLASNVITTKFPLDELLIDNRKQKFLIPEEFLPQSGAVVINGVRYNTVVAYAYSVLFKKANYNIDVNSLDLKDLCSLYTKVRDEKFKNDILRNNEKGMNYKFSDDSLMALLYQTSPNSLTWDNPNDLILGKGENGMGKYLELIRTRIVKVPIIKSPTDNSVTKFWLGYRAADYANTLKITNYLSNIYRIAPITGGNISKVAIKILRQNGVPAEYYEVVASFIMAEFNKLMPNFYENMVKAEDTSYPTPQDLAAARNNLSKVYKVIQTNVDESRFIDIILSNSLSEAAKPLWRKINDWKKA